MTRTRGPRTASCRHRLTTERRPDNGEKKCRFGNSPFAVSSVNFDGKTIIQRTSAGTQGITSASQAERLYAAALVTARVNYRFGGPVIPRY